MFNRKALPIALTIAGSDSGGGAGIQADLKTFAALQVHGTSAITCVTAQNPREVKSIQPLKRSMVRDQVQAILQELPPSAAKTGMLFSKEIISEIAEAWRQKPCPLVVDPVMVSTSGATLLKPAAIRTLLDQLMPLADLVTPNLDEAQLILGEKLASISKLEAAARKIFQRFGCAALVKGGHLRTSPEAIDIFYDGRRELVLRADFVRNISTHGTGCTYSAAITAYLARGRPLPKAVTEAKNFITEAIRRSRSIGNHTVLGHNVVWK